MAQSQDAVYATLVMTDSYLPGAMVMGHSLRDRGAKAKLVACVLVEKLSQDTITELQTVYDEIIAVQQIVNMQPANLFLMNRPDLISTFTKIELWKQTQYKRIVYLDADIVVLRAPNELLTMTLESKLAAVPDVGWPDCFNSGMMVLNPNLADYYSLLALAQRGISFDGADQGLLNMHFREWDRLSFTYNCTPNANYQYVPAYKYFQNTINMIHFIGADKPWTQGREYRTNSGVYSELLGRWWSVYDAHYRRPQSASQDQFLPPRTKIQDYVRGEETRHEPQPQPRRQPNSGYSITQPQPQPAPGLHYTAQQADVGAQERPFGDQPSLAERIEEEGFQPTSTMEQRRWSAPHAEWQPDRQPPPVGSKPEAANFPTQQYEMSADDSLFEPPASYPEPPKDMWYEVPKEKPRPSAPPKMIFPWEERAPKATRVFPKSRESTPPPVEEENTPGGAESESRAISSSESDTQGQGGSQEPSQTFVPPKPPSPPRHVFPWESRAPKATRVFPQEKAPSPPPNTARAAPDREPPAASAVEEALNKTIAQASRSPDNPWDAFAQQSNKWDEDPEISRFMESFNRPRKAQVHVLHDNRTPSADPGQGPPPVRERRTSLKLTDFPTEVERPSLPVTPAPIRRPTMWGSDEQEEQSVLPIAQGVPRQDEWVRHFTSQCLPDFPDPMLRDIGGVLHLTCQHCRRQNPIIKLEELQRRQSQIMNSGGRFEGTKTPPRRQMPDSKTREEAIEAAMKGMNMTTKGPVIPHSILKEPKFEISGADDDELNHTAIIPTSHTLATGSKSPTRFNPIVLEGEAASTRNSYMSLDPETLLTEHSTALNDEASTATHHHAGLPRSNSSHEQEGNGAMFNAAVTLPAAEEALSPTSVA